MRVLVVEDDPDLSEILTESLAEEGYGVDLARTEEDGRWRATTVDYDVVVLDVMLPDGSGIEILREMRRTRRRAPVLILTARDATEDRVAGLDAGADDYLVKPFAWAEFLARLRALLRRGPRGAAGVLRHGDLELDPAARTFRVAGADVALTSKEFELVYVLMSEPGRVFSRTEIIEKIYDDESGGTSNVIDVLLSRIRRKLARDGAAAAPGADASSGDSGDSWIRTVRGVGYVLARAGDA